MKINFGFIVNNGPSDKAPCLNRREVALKEHDHVGGQEVNGLLDMEVVYAKVFGENGLNSFTSGSTGKVASIASAVRM